MLGRPVLRRGGRREWLRVARSELEAHRARQAQPIARDREDRLLDALERFEENQRVDLAANEAYERWRATARDTKGRVLKGNSKPFTAPELPEGVINLSDPDSRVMRTHGTPPRQAYNAQAAVNDRQIVLAAEITLDARTSGISSRCSRPPSSATPSTASTSRPRWCSPMPATGTPAQIASDRERRDRGARSPRRELREGQRPGWEHGRYEQMREKLTTDRGRELYAQRKTTIEPVFGQIKHNRHIDRFMRRGRAAAQSEWRLVTATHNLLKLHSHWIATPA